VCCPLLPLSFSTFIDVCRAEQKLVDSGIAVAPPERVRDHTASHMPVPLTLAIIRERRSDADDAPTVTVSTVTVPTVTAPTVNVPTVTAPTVTVPIEPSGDVDGNETSESSESDSNSDTGEDTGDASDAGDVQASDAGDIQASDARDDPTSDAGDDKPSGENRIGDSIPGHAGKEPSTSVPFSEHVEACDISSSSVDPLLVSQLSSEHIQGDEISTIAPAVLESSIIPGKLIYFFFSIYSNLYVLDVPLPSQGKLFFYD